MKKIFAPIAEKRRLEAEKAAAPRAIWVAEQIERDEMYGPIVPQLFPRRRKQEIYVNRFVTPSATPEDETESLIAIAPPIPPRKHGKPKDAAPEPEAKEEEPEAPPVPKLDDFFLPFPLLSDDFDDRFPPPIPPRKRKSKVQELDENDEVIGELEPLDDDSPEDPILISTMFQIRGNFTFPTTSTFNAGYSQSSTTTPDDQPTLMFDIEEFVQQFMDYNPFQFAEADTPSDHNYVSDEEDED
uniref:Uncharacterized protein n=1 Tax=Panagrolaimus sp. JU765 TaxID=591449 RepID=A0AC34QKB7_9BILA